MKQNNIVEIICLFFVILFVYTGVSKFLDYDNFRAVIGQSPIITKYSGVLSIIVPAIEIVVSIFLVIPRYRLQGLYATFSLMILFTAYIIILVTLSDHAPCSCGGVIQKMSWNQHLVFNIILIFISLLGIILHSKYSQPRKMSFS